MSNEIDYSITPSVSRGPIGRRRNNKDDEVTRLAREGMGLQEEFGARIREVTNTPPMDAEGLVDLYTRANFEQRHSMFLEILGSQGADGLELLGDVFGLANERFRGEG